MPEGVMPEAEQDQRAEIEAERQYEEANEEEAQ
jgi:hypothetical protein